MKKKAHVRPLFIAMALCNGDIIPATLFVEIMFRMKITQFKNGDDPLLIQSVQSWSTLTGLSEGQVGKALQRLQCFGLLSKFAKPWGSAMKVTHISIPKKLYELFNGIVDGNFGYYGDKLRINGFQQPIDFPLSEQPLIGKPPPKHTPCAFDLSHAEETNITNAGDHEAPTGNAYKEKQSEKEKKVDSAESKFAGMKTGKKKGVLEQNEGVCEEILNRLKIPKELHSVVYLQRFLLRLRLWYGHNFELPIDAWDGHFYTGDHLAEEWREKMQQMYPYQNGGLSFEGAGLLTLMIKLYGREASRKIVHTVCTQWHDVCENLFVYGIKAWPMLPDPIFVYRHMEQLRLVCKLSSKQKIY